MDVVFACTGNICRSPMAEAILRARLAERAPDVTIASAGLRFDGRSAERQAIKTMAKRGLDLSEFRSRILSAEVLSGCSLMLGMERTHVREAAVIDPDLFARAYTLPEFAAGAAMVGRRGDEPLADWVDRVGTMRTREAYLTDDPSSEVADPIGRSGRAFRACADELETLIGSIVDLAWPVPVGTVGGPRDQAPPIGERP